MTDIPNKNPVAFVRSLGSDAESRLASLYSQEWWHDLLSLWRPAGQSSEEHGLRLAIRNGTINFYRKGQSVAKVGFDRSKTPYLEIHVAYVTGKEGLGQHYARLSNDELICRSYPGSLDKYKGIETLKTWISNAGDYAGEEKMFVDNLVGSNPNVIDLEMALPNFVAKDKDRKVALRMDLVALEESNGRNAVVFWEAKMMNNGELRRLDNDEPKLLEQLSNYQEWMGTKDRVRMRPNDRVNQVEVAYKRNCEHIVLIHSQAKKINPYIMELGDLVNRVACSPDLPIVSKLPRVVIDDPKKSISWHENGHAKKLSDAGYFVQLIQDNSNAAYILRGGE